MITRRTFTTRLAGMAGVAATPRLWSQTAMSKTVLYASVGPELTLFDIDMADAALAKRGGHAAGQYPVRLDASVDHRSQLAINSHVRYHGNSQLEEASHGT